MLADPNANNVACQPGTIQEFGQPWGTFNKLLVLGLWLGLWLGLSFFLFFRAVLPDPDLFLRRRGATLLQGIAYTTTGWGRPSED